jgi:hypothetical protein
MLSFDPLAGNPEASSVTGCLLTKGGKPILVDPNTFQVTELRGTGWQAEWGNRVTVTGDAAAGPTVSIAGQVLQITNVSRVAAGGCRAVATDQRIQADPNPPSGTTTTTSTTAPKSGSHTGWIVGGVLIAGGAIGGIVAATHGKKSGS